MKTAILLSLLLSFTLSLHADEIYQITDEHGRKTYTNIAPQQPKGEVEKVKLRNTNIRETQSLQSFDTMPAEAEQSAEIQQRLKQDAQQALNAVQQAEAALEQARELRPGDYFNIPGKGLRYTEQYHSRIKRAEQQLESAQQNHNVIKQRKPAEAPYDATLWQDNNAPK